MAVAAGGAATSATSCAKLHEARLPGIELESSVWVASGSVIRNDFPPIATAPQPAHCLVHGEIGRHVGKDGIEYGDKFELRLPETWNGKLLFQGGGGLDGVL